MDWCRAFAKQACSDFAVREMLEHAGLPECHQLHYLQMAMEKAAKAHLIAGGSDPFILQSSHAYIAKVVPTIVRQGLARSRGAASRWVIDAVRSLARRIELLHPQIDDNGAVPANCEYPWQSAGGNIVAPLDHSFGLNLLTETAGRTMIKEVRARAIELANRGET